jgi:ABC-type glycerol-3-phosphate transport system substrate-binding protein
MKKTALALIGGLVISASLFAGGQQSGGGSATSSDGLSVVKVFGVDKKYVIRGEERKFSDWYSGKVPSKLFDQLNADLAKSGIKLEFDSILEDQMATMFQTMLASGDVDKYDFVTAGSGREQLATNLYNQGRMYPLNKAIDQYSTGPAKTYYYNNEYGSFFRKMATMEDGNFYWVTQACEFYYKDPSNLTGVHQAGQIRYDWLKTLGLQMPKTLDEFTRALTAFQTNDMNKNGIKDEVASISMTGWGTGIAQWFGLGNDLVAVMDNKAVSPWYQPKVQDYISYLNQLYKAGLIQIDSEGGAMAANRIAYLYDWGPVSWNEPNIVVPSGAEKPYFVPFVIQATPDTKPRVWQQAGNYRVFNPHFIPARAKNIEGAAKLLDYLVSDEYATLTEFGIEDYTFIYNAEGEAQWLESNPANVGYDVELMSSAFPALWTNIACLPRRKVEDVRRELNQIKADGYQLKADFEEAAWNNTWPFVQDKATLLAFPTAKEMERIQAISTDLTTYSEELLTSLILGEKSLSNWNAYMADLKRLGLDELISITQARVSRGL